ncbi:MAG: AbrB/MazE/SpoVT family DNA-binding domain-containing protein [Thermoanaerobaculaceae bacterium]|nr:AbrB/MazE/SpoVT family DNA-binding domain-containing protein [Thermoanaerobaculaceae bacterium]
MATVKVSPKYQVVIPREVREELGIRAGEKVQIFLYDGRIEFVPVKSVRKMRGMLKGMDTAVEREQDRL